MVAADDTTRSTVLEHIEAFNAHDRGRILAGLHEAVEWATGVDVYRGLASLADLFDDGLWALNPSLRVETLLVEGDIAAAECVEEITSGAQVMPFRISVFFTVRDGLIRRVKVCREGTADLPELCPD